MSKTWRKGRERKKVKVFNDPVHGHVEIHPLAVAIVDTPHFQRLRDLLQVGPTYFVFPGTCGENTISWHARAYQLFSSFNDDRHMFLRTGASHRRFSHSIGVSYLAGKYVEVLRRTLAKNPISRKEQQITDADALCVQIAGLCHDLGHGPFSHTYDGKFVRAQRPDRSDWTHEHASADLIDHLIKTNEGMMDLFRSYGLDEDDVHFIKELIFGHKSEAPKGWVWKGRGSSNGKAKQFLYEIVANHRNGIDVDKFDYFARDSMHLGMTISFDASRLMKFARVLVDKTTGESQIAYHEKEAWNIFELFHTRYNLHKRAYQHRVARAVEAMLNDALILADPHIDVSGGCEKNVVRMSQAFETPTHYTNLTDSILKIIEYESRKKDAHADLIRSNRLLDRIKVRNLYTHIAEKLLDPKEWGSKSKAETRTTILADVMKAIECDVDRATLRRIGIYVDVVKINYGMGKRSPIEFITFYLRSTDFDNGSEIEGRTLDPHRISCFVPHVFEESYARLYVKHFDSIDAAESDRLRDVARAAFDRWANTKRGGSPVPMTPERKKRRTAR